MEIVANTFWGGAVVTDAIFKAGSIAVETRHVDRCGCGACSRQGGRDITCDLVETDDEDDVLGSEGYGCDAVAIAVDVDDDAILAYCVCRGKVVVGGEGFAINLLYLIGVGGKVTVVDGERRDAIMECTSESHVAYGHAAAPSYGATVGYEVEDEVYGFCGCWAEICFEMAVLKVFYEAFAEHVVSDLFRGHD